MRLRSLAGVWSGQAAALGSRVLGGGGSTLPGRVALRVAPRLLHDLSSRSRRGNILVTGTNGKTTTSALIATILEEHGWRLVHNSSGANLLSGLTAAFLEAVGPTGQADWDCALLEVDEATVPAAAEAVRPRVMVVNNFFRDQLDRYGELDTVVARVRDGLEQLTADGVAVLNADDPLVAELGRGLGCRVLTFGVDAPEALRQPDRQTALGDAKRCPTCGSRYSYTRTAFAHLGHYRCGGCGFERPRPDVVLTHLRSRGPDGMVMTVAHGEERLTLSTGLPGLYNAYNVLAAVSAAAALELPSAATSRAVAGFSTAFGRMERIEMEGRRVLLALIKNPVGAGQVLETVISAADGSGALLVAINDQTADGHDISWLWDADFEQLAAVHDLFRRIIVSGLRAEDMAVRLKYAGVPTQRIQVEGSLEGALAAGMEAVAEGATLYVLPTYTAMLDLRRVIQRQGHVRHYLEA